MIGHMPGGPTVSRLGRAATRRYILSVTLEQTLMNQTS